MCGVFYCDYTKVSHTNNTQNLVLAHINIVNSTVMWTSTLCYTVQSCKESAEKGKLNQRLTLNKTRFDRAVGCTVGQCTLDKPLDLGLPQENQRSS